jgi:hypothetical protein
VRSAAPDEQEEDLIEVSVDADFPSRAMPGPGPASLGEQESFFLAALVLS